MIQTTSSEMIVGSENPFTRLYIPVRLEVTPTFSFEVSALVDTGCETNLIRKGLVSDKHFHAALKPVNFIAANKTVVTGGHRELCCTLSFDGVDPDTGLHQQIKLPFSCLDADIGEGI